MKTRGPARVGPRRAGLVVNYLQVADHFVNRGRLFDRDVEHGAGFQIREIVAVGQRRRAIGLARMVAGVKGPSAGGYRRRW